MTNCACQKTICHCSTSPPHPSPPPPRMVSLPPSLTAHTASQCFPHPNSFMFQTRVATLSFSPCSFFFFFVLPPHLLPLTSSHSVSALIACRSCAPVLAVSHFFPATSTNLFLFPNTAAITLSAPLVSLRRGAPVVQGRSSGFVSPRLFIKCDKC